MFCVKCGTEYRPADKACPSCGEPPPATEGLSPAPPLGGPIDVSTPPLGSPPPQQGSQAEAPYPLFVSTFLGSLLLLSVVVFNIGDAVARKYWRSSMSTLVALLGGSLLVWACWRAWRRIIDGEPESDLRTRFRHRDMIITSTVFAIFGLALSGVIGLVIGRNGAEMTKLVADSARLAVLSDEISEARNTAEATVPSHVVMYIKIEPTVQEWEFALGQYQADLAVYDNKFPDQHLQTGKMIAAVKIGLQRAGLLKQQIAVAKAISQLAEEQQWPVWQAQMQPLLDQEDALLPSK